MKTSIKGWAYITAIFHYLEQMQKAMPKSILEPHYIFRGISKRYFTSSSFFQNVEKYNEKYEEVKSVLAEYVNTTDYLKVISECPKEIFPEYIRSGASVRLKDMEHRTYNDYINYHQALIIDAKNRFPVKYQDLTDIEILADIQHKGGATCMVDFSNNFLTSLWFAVQNDFEDIGYLFCYDIHKDMIEMDYLSCLGPQKEKRKIHELLYDTTKSSNYDGNSIYKFWLWKPSNLNMRIARQDSVFVFGLEPFNISEHKVIVIPIPPHWKQCILQTLKKFFGINAESIYCDDYGLATSNSKLNYYDKTIDIVFSNEIFGRQSEDPQFSFAGFQNGMSCLLNEQYEIALKYFLEYESFAHPYLYSTLKNNEDDTQILNIRVNNDYISDIIEVELCFSKALCYKNMEQREAAIYEYELALNKYLVKDLLSNLHLKNKLYKILNDYIDLLYDVEHFDKVENVIDTYIGKYLNKDEKLTYFIQTMKNEVKFLKMLKEQSFNPMDINVGETPQALYNMLNHFFKFLSCIGADLGKEIETTKETYESKVNIARFSERKDFQNKTKWNLSDIENAIEKYYKDNCEKLSIFRKETAKLKGTIDYINSKYTIASY